MRKLFLLIVVLSLIAPAALAQDECGAYVPLPLFGEVVPTWRHEFFDARETDGVMFKQVMKDGSWYMTFASDAGRTSTDIVTRRYAPDGQIIWERAYAGANGLIDWPAALHTDSDGNVYMLGWSMDQDPERDLVLVKYSARGALLWSTRYSHSEESDEHPYALASDAAGNLYITGGYSIWTGSPYVFTASYNPEGNQRWFRVSARGFGHDISVGPDSSLYVAAAGYLPDEEYGIREHFAVTRYSANGDSLWTYNYRPADTKQARALRVEVDALGDVYATGGWIANDQSYFDFVTVKLSPSGEEVWSRPYGGDQDDYPLALALRPGGGVFVLGHSMDQGFYRWRLRSYSTDGEPLWTRSVGEHDACTHFFAQTLAVDELGNAYAGGYSHDNSNLGGFEHAAVVKFDPDGTLVWGTHITHTSDFEHGIGSMNIGLDLNGKVHLSYWALAGANVLGKYRLVHLQQPLSTRTEDPSPAGPLALWAYPVPASSQVSIAFALSSAATTYIAAYDVMGRRLAVLYDGTCPTGPNQVMWDVTAVPPGLYIVQLRAGTATAHVSVVISR